jgi:hypothetical protein
MVCKPVVWFPLLFLGWIWFLWSEVRPQAQFELQTGAAQDPDSSFFGSSTWANVQAVSDDGEQVTLGIHRGGRHWVKTHLEVWDVRTGDKPTPTLWEDAEWELLLSRPAWMNSGTADLLSHPAGREFLRDEAAWAGLRRRFTSARSRALEDLRKTLRPMADSEAPHVFPDSITFAPDGKCLAYVARNGWPLYGGVAEELGDGMAVEDVGTGAPLAFLPRVTDEFHIAPGGRTAVSRHHPTGGEGEQPRLILWDLATSTRRAGLLLPDVNHPLFHVWYSADGRFVFASWWNMWEPYANLRWWDAATGRQIGEVANAGRNTPVIDSGRVLMTHPGPLEGTHKRHESYILCFWDVATGAPLGEWALAAPSDGSGLIWHLAEAETGQYVAAEYDPDYGGGPGSARRVADGLARAFGAAAPDHQCILLLDVTQRREIARLPGRSAVLSPNGRWLATLDKAGVVRVWAVPIQRPWARIMVYSAVAALACGVGLVFVGRLGRRCWRSGLGRQLVHLLTDRRRRRLVVGAGGCLALIVGAFWWYAAAAARAKAVMVEAYEKIREGMSEAQVTALVGTPPDEGPVEEMTVRRKGGKSGHPTMLRRWRQYGTELDVWFDANGTVRGAYISDPLGLTEEFMNWLGW